MPSPLPQHIQTGQYGEKAAVAYLINIGHTVINTNWQCKHLEIDIITVYNNIVHFIEVKTRKANNFMQAKECLSQKKQAKLERAAEAWLLANPIYDMPCQFDFIAITLNSEGKIHDLEYITNYTR